MTNQTQYVVFFQDNTRKNFLSLESLADNLESIDALNVVDFFSEPTANEYEAIWEGEYHCEPCLIRMA